MDKERIFDGRKIVKRKVQDALSLTYFQMLPSKPVSGVSTKARVASVALINGHKSSKRRRATNLSSCHHIAIR